jgi:hypothetical protein
VPGPDGAMCPPSKCDRGAVGGKEEGRVEGQEGGVMGEEGDENVSGRGKGGGGGRGVQSADSPLSPTVVQGGRGRGRCLDEDVQGVGDGGGGEGGGGGGKEACGGGGSVEEVCTVVCGCCQSCG